MKKWTMLVLSSLLSVWLLTGIAYAEEGKGKSETKTVANYQVEFITQADGSKVGENNLAVQIKDVATGKPVVRDAVRVELSMDAADSSMSHGGMKTQAPVVADLKAEKDVPGKYSGKANLGYTGNWNAKVIVDPASARSVTFQVQVDSAGPNFVVIGGILVVIVAVIAIAVVALKKKAPESETTIAPAEAIEG